MAKVTRLPPDRRLAGMMHKLRAAARGHGHMLAIDATDRMHLVAIPANEDANGWTQQDVAECLRVAAAAQQHMMRVDERFGRRVYVIQVDNELVFSVSVLPRVDGNAA